MGSSFVFVLEAATPERLPLSAGGAVMCLPMVPNSRLVIYDFILSRGSDSEGERGEHHWKDLLASHSLDPEQVRAPSL